MKRCIKRIIAVCSIVLIGLCSLVLTQNHVDSNTLRIQGFYQEETNSIDVVFYGASEVFTGYSPGLAYGEYGFTSYPYSADANNITFLSSQIKETLNYQTPKCLVIETGGIRDTFGQELNEEQLAVLRQFTDVMPLSQNKIDIINRFVKKDKLSYYVPSFAHCGKSENFENTLTSFSQYFRGFTYLKGIISTNSKQEYEEIIDANHDLKTMDLSNEAYSFIDDLLDYCETLDCKVIFVRFPHRVTNDDEHDKLKQHNEIGRVITERGFDFINLDHAINEIGLDLEKDFYSDSHLNAHGQIKNTRYLCKLLSEQYGVGKSTLSQKNMDRWEKSYEYTKLFYKYYDLHENDAAINVWYENPDLIKQLDSLRES